MVSVLCFLSIKNNEVFMALPLIWLGVAAVSALTIKGLNDDRESKQKQRRNTYRAQRLSSLKEYESPIAIYPSDFLVTGQKVAPCIGAIVCCGIGGVLDHTGIWLGDDTIVELAGNGLIKAVSSRRFIEERSGKQIFIASDSQGKPLADVEAARRASEQIFQYREYHMLDNNCHHFVWQCFSPEDKGLSTFKSLSCRLAQYYDRVVYWDICDC
jgi:hypothetical protein